MGGITPAWRSPSWGIECCLGIPSFLPGGQNSSGVLVTHLSDGVDCLEETDSKGIVSGSDFQSILSSYPTRQSSPTFRKSYH